MIGNIFRDDVKQGLAYAGVYNRNDIFSIQYGAFQSPYGIQFQYFYKDNIQRYPGMTLFCRIFVDY